MEGVLAVFFIFGGGSLFLLAISPIGRAIATRIQGGTGDGLPGDVVERLENQQQALLDEIDALRQDLLEVQERLDFAERALLRPRDALPASGESES